MVVRSSCVFRANRDTDLTMMRSIMPFLQNESTGGCHDSGGAEPIACVILQDENRSDPVLFASYSPENSGHLHI